MGVSRRLSTKRQFEYRLVWAYKGSPVRHLKISQQPSGVLKMLRRLATSEPWMGTGVGQMRKAWNHYQMRTELDWATVAPMTLKAVMLAIQRSYPELDYIRVEFRQVGAWTAQLDPLNTLRSSTADATEARQTALVERIEAMPREELDNWRLLPPAERGDLRPSTERKRVTRGYRYNLGGPSSRVKRATTSAATGGATSGFDKP